MKTLLPQVLEEVERVKTRQDKINVLKAYDSQQLRGLLQINFNPNVKMDLPEGTPPFKRDEKIQAGFTETNLYAEFRRLYVWLQADVNVTKLRKEHLFIQLLEGIHYTEADVLCLAKDKKLETKYKTLTEDIIREAFPDILPPKPPEPILEKIEKVTKVKKSKVSLKGSPVTSNETSPNL